MSSSSLSLDENYNNNNNHEKKLVLRSNLLADDCTEDEEDAAGNMVDLEESYYQLFLEQDEEEDIETIKMNTLIRQFKNYSVLIGACCGVFVQLSTLGANFLLVVLLGEDSSDSSRVEEGALPTPTPSNQKQAMLFSLGWSFFTSCMALLILALLRGLVSSILDNATSSSSTSPAGQQQLKADTDVDDDDEEVEDDDEDREALMMIIEVRYVVGALTGVCFAWTFTDLLLGMQSLALYSLGTLIVALCWSKAMIWYFVVTPPSNKKKEQHKDNKEQEVEEVEEKQELLLSPATTNSTTSTTKTDLTPAITSLDLLV